MTSLIRPMIVMLVVILIGSVGAFWYSYNGAASSGAVQNSQDIGVCLRQVAQKVSDAKDTQITTIGWGLYFLGKNDQASFAEELSSYPQIIAVIKATTDQYKATLKQSLSDPDKFLESCRK